MGNTNDIDELIAAYDPSTRVFSPSDVSTDVLASPEGQAFVHGISLATSGASAAELDDAIVALRDQSFPSASVSPSKFLVLMTGGADPWPYVQLTNDEQKAMVTGSESSSRTVYARTTAK